MTQQSKAYLFAGISVLLWSTVASAFKLALARVDVLPVLFYATLTSTVTLLAVVIGQRKTRLFFDQTRRDLLHSAVMGLFNPFVYYLILFKAYALLPAQEAQPLNWTWPIVLSLLSAAVFKHRLSPRAVIAIFISFCGVVIISLKGNFAAIQFSNPFGSFLALISSIFWAIYWILNLKDRRDSVIKLALNFCFGLVYIGLLAGWTHNIVGLSAYEFGLVAYIGLFEMGITFVTWLYALQHSTNSARVANLAYLAPFISLIFIALIVGERILPSSIVGLGFIVSGIALQASGGKNEV